MLKQPKLLTRDEFREAVFKRDNYQCVVCGASDVPLDAHHILERKLWGDGGYYIENGASVCEEHHIEAEQTVISCDALREKCGISRVVLPDHLYKDQMYDKWGNPILPNGQRMKGELFLDPSVQKILSPVLHLFTNRVKYPRTYHLPWSPGVTKDDRIISDLSCFQGQSVVVTAKMDGENTTMYRDGIHARSLEYDAHPSRAWVKSLHARIAHEIPENWRICGENLYAKHSIHYTNLSDLFLVFSIWDGLRCLPWKDTVEYAEVLGLRTVPVLVGECTWEHGFDKELVALGSSLEKNGLHGDPSEGYVVRLADEFAYGAFRRSAGKYVRANHVATSHHWRFEKLVPNLVGAKSDDGNGA